MEWTGQYDWPCEDRDTGGHHVRTEAETGLPQLSITKKRQRLQADQQKLGRGKEVFPSRFPGSRALLTPSFLTYSLQNSDTIHLCGLKPPRFWYPLQWHQKSTTQTATTPKVRPHHDYWWNSYISRSGRHYRLANSTHSLLFPYLLPTEKLFGLSHCSRRPRGPFLSNEM